MTKKLRDILYPTCPYAGLDPSQYPDDLQGWGSDHPVLAAAIEKLRPKRIVEVGSWKGRSAINMARTVRALGLECEIICVDTWLGSPEHWLRAAPGWFESLMVKNGYPRLYYTFLGNVLRHGFQDIITPMPMTSESARLCCAISGSRAISLISMPRMSTARRSAISWHIGIYWRTTPC